MSSFGELIAPAQLSEFFRDVVGKTYRVFEPGRNVTSKLLSWNLLQTALETSSYSGERSIFLAKAGESSFRKPIDLDHVSDETGLVDTTGIYNDVRAGSTLIFNNIHQHLPMLSRLGADMRRHLAEMPSFNCYASIRPEPGLGLHWDDHDVIAIQAEGRKFWQLYQPMKNRPFKHQSKEPVPTKADLLWEGYLEAGQCLYVPRGMWHSVLSTGLPSLHITCGFFGITLQNIVSFLMQHDTEIFGLTDTVFPEYMSDVEIRKFEQGAREKLDVLLSDGFLKQFWINKKANLPHSSAHSAFDDPATLTELNADTVVNSRMPENPDLCRDGEAAFFVVNATEYDLPVDMFAVFDAIAKMPRKTVGQLRAVGERNGLKENHIDAFLMILHEQLLVEFVKV